MMQKRVETPTKKRPMGILIVSIIKGVILIMLVLGIKNIHLKLEEMQTRLMEEIRTMSGRTEVSQYETVESPDIDKPDDEDYVNSIEIMDIEKPVQRTLAETIERLGELGKNNTVIAEIYKNSSLYPENLLTALANNPEMADFVAGYLQDDRSSTSGLTDSEKAQTFPLFLQWDPRWGYQSYGSESNIGVSGCGPTCMSMVLYYMTGNEKLTPDRIAAYALNNGYYVEGTGTSWSLMEDIPQICNLTVRNPEVSEMAFKAELDKGNIIICAMGAGDFTVAGHFIVLYGYDRDGFKINDPNCVARSGKIWTFDELKGQIRQVWSYGG